MCLFFYVKPYVNRTSSEGSSDISIELDGTSKFSFIMYIPSQTLCSEFLGYLVMALESA